MSNWNRDDDERCPGMIIPIMLVIALVVLFAVMILDADAQQNTLPLPPPGKDLHQLMNGEVTEAEIPNRVVAMMKQPLWQQCQVRMNMIVDGAKIEATGGTIRQYLTGLQAWMEVTAAREGKGWRRLNSGEYLFLVDHMKIGRDAMRSYKFKAAKPPSKMDMMLHAKAVGLLWNGSCMQGKQDRRL